jgi:hypothetical protein
MNMQHDIIKRFHTTLPKIRHWIDQLFDDYADRARTVDTLGFTRLPVCFSQELLKHAKAVTVERVPFPPVDQFGLPELSDMQKMSFDGITFRDTFFLRQGRLSENLYFHELVHVVQWARLGVDNFLMAYGLGLLQFGYHRCPLEQMAYALEREFEHGTLPGELERIIEKRTDAIWSQVAPFVQALKGDASWP